MPSQSDSIPSMSGKTCLLTGGTSGIGLATAEALARAGADLIIVGRNPDRCEQTVARLKSTSENPHIEAITADLSVQSDVHRAAEEFLRRRERLHVLINNAGGIFTERLVTPDGLERTWALNHLAYFLLTHRLIEVLKASAPARVVSVASDAHRSARHRDLEAWDPEPPYKTFRAYARSKLANILFSNELARRLAGSGVTANALHPGFVATQIFKGPTFFNKAAEFAASLVAVRPEVGAQTSIYLATSPEVEGKTGGYYQRRKPAQPSAAARDPEAARRLWERSARQTRLNG